VHHAFLFLALVGLAPGFAADTVVKQVQQQQVGLPTGLSYEAQLRFLRRLQPIEGAARVGAPTGSPDGITRREIDGLVVDETQTKIGRDFYQLFYTAWDAPPDATNYTVRVQEQPSPSLGTRIVVLINDEVLFQLQLQPRYEVIEELAQQAALYTRRELESMRPAALPAAAGDPPSDPSAPPPDAGRTP
jgi:hypothetical protein